MYFWRPKYVIFMLSKIAKNVLKIKRNIFAIFLKNTHKICEKIFYIIYTFLYLSWLLIFIVWSFLKNIFCLFVLHCSLWSLCKLTLLLSFSQNQTKFANICKHSRKDLERYPYYYLHCCHTYNQQVCVKWQTQSISMFETCSSKDRWNGILSINAQLNWMGIFRKIHLLILFSHVKNVHFHYLPHWSKQDVQLDQRQKYFEIFFWIFAVA